MTQNYQDWIKKVASFYFQRVRLDLDSFLTQKMLFSHISTVCTARRQF